MEKKVYVPNKFELRRVRYRTKWGSQQEIARKYGLSAMALGKILIRSGLKNKDGYLPTRKGINGGYAHIHEAILYDRQYALWNKAKVGALLEKIGYKAIRPEDHHKKRVASEIKNIISQPVNHSSFEIHKKLQDLDETLTPVMKEPVWQHIARMYSTSSKHRKPNNPHLCDTVWKYAVDQLTEKGG